MSPLVVFLLSALVAACVVALSYWHKAGLALKREQRADMLYTLGEALSEARDVLSISRVVSESLSAYLGCPSALFVDDPKSSPIEACAALPPGSGDIFLSPDEVNRIHRVFLSGSTDTLIDENEKDVYYHPVAWDEAVLGVFGVHCTGKPLDAWRIELIQSICRQSAHALVLQRARDAHSDLRIDAEKEKMRGNLLSSISHDFRTPLTSILGASTTVIEQKDMLVEMRDSLLSDIRDNAEWLIRMVENILMVTRISQETMQLHKRLETAEEVIAQSVSIVRSRYADCMIHVKVPDEPVMVPMDAALISQVIINLLLNAISHSEEGSFVLLTLQIKDGFALFEVRDHGSGIPAHLLDTIFEIHAQVDEQGNPITDLTVDPAHGMGIGLSICRTIIQAHGGVIEGHNRREGGAKFSFWLPLDEDKREE
ncbi:MAG: ATP-binding protein [Clostridiales bacterium]|nr:ATP-binding protein [Clostridiales bacterium]